MHQHLRRKHAEVALVSSLLLSGLPFVASQLGPEIIYSVAGEDWDRGLVGGGREDDEAQYFTPHYIF